MTSKSSITIDRLSFPPVHPGEILAEEIEARGVSATGLARALDVPGNRITEIIAGKRGVTADTATRLAIYLGTTAKFWMNLQAAFDLAKIAEESGAEIARRVRPAAA